MTYTLIYSEAYIKRAKQFLSKHPDLEKAYQKVLFLLEKNPHHPSLRLHALNLKKAVEQCCVILANAGIQSNHATARLSRLQD